MRKVRGFIPPEPEPEQRDPAPAPRAAPPPPVQREPEPPGTGPGEGGPVRYVSTGFMAAKFALSASAFGNLLRRYRDDPEHPSPRENATTDSDGKSVLGWLPEREDEIGAWLGSLPGTGSSPRSGRWREEAGAAPEGAQWVSLTGSRGVADHVMGENGETLCGIKPKGTSEPRGQRQCSTCAQVAARNTA